MLQLLVVGDPIDHSRSPIFQQAGIDAIGANAVYSRRRVSTEAELTALADEVRTSAIHGVNITLPHKAQACSLADRRLPAAETLGVANTWFRADDGALVADNTDVYGIQASVAALGTLPHRVMVLGAGGAATAAVYALRHAAHEIVVANRTVSRAEAVVESLRPMLPDGLDVRSGGWPSAEASDVPYDLIVQATSLPVLSPKHHAPFDAIPFGPGSGAVLELCYSPGDTVIMSIARRHGVPTLDGATMLLHQGVRSFQHWFEEEADVAAMRDALAESLGRRSSAVPATPDPDIMAALQGADG